MRILIALSIITILGFASAQEELELEEHDIALIEAQNSTSTFGACDTSCC
jgi:hypothetical protein